jgi:hypothetical protein
MKNIESFPLTDSNLREIEDCIYTDGNNYYIGLKFEQSIIFEQVLRKQFVMR